jgi:hypothetical protein
VCTQEKVLYKESSSSDQQTTKNPHPSLLVLVKERFEGRSISIGSIDNQKRRESVY